MQPMLPDLNVELGYAYHSAAVIPDSSADASLHFNPRETRARPGTRAPHYWLERNGRQVSTLDLIDRHFVLVAAADGTFWCDSARAAAEIGVELDVLRVGQDGLLDPTGGFDAAYGLEPSGCVLIRPDGVIAWRAPDQVPSQSLREVLSTVLSRS
jgi:hypothetical protein